jgi:hypothetical protein
MVTVLAVTPGVLVAAVALPASKPVEAIPNVSTPTDNNVTGRRSCLNIKNLLIGLGVNLIHILVTRQYRARMP